MKYRVSIGKTTHAYVIVLESEEGNSASAYFNEEADVVNVHKFFDNVAMYVEDRDPACLEAVAVDFYKDFGVVVDGVGEGDCAVLRNLTSIEAANGAALLVGKFLEFTARAEEEEEIGESA